VVLPHEVAREGADLTDLTTSLVGVLVTVLSPAAIREREDD